MSDTLETESDAVAGFEAALGKSFGEAPPEKAPPTELEVPEEIELKEAQEPEEEKPESKTYRVKVDGKEIEVPEEELLKGYSRNQDYTQKTMALAEERKQTQAIAQQAAQERQIYAQRLSMYEQALGQQLQQQTPNWEELLQTDPVEYLKQQHLYNQRQAQLSQIQQEKALFERQSQAYQAQSMQELLAQEQAQLLENLPSWKDPAKAAAEKTALAKHLVERGYTQEQVAQLTDHKTVVMAREAMLYRQMMAKAKDTYKQVEKLPPRMEKPGVTRPTDGRTNDMQALKKSGKAEDAAALFAKMF